MAARSARLRIAAKYAEGPLRRWLRRRPRALSGKYVEGVDYVMRYERLQAALLAVPLLLMLVLIFTLLFAAPVRAEEDPTCGAKDLLAALKASDPAAYEKLRAEGGKIKNSGARFWKVEKAGLAPNWLLGTMR